MPPANYNAMHTCQPAPKMSMPTTAAQSTFSMLIYIDATHGLAGWLDSLTAGISDNYHYLGISDMALR